MRISMTLSLSDIFAQHSKGAKILEHVTSTNSYPEIEKENYPLAALADYVLLIQRIRTMLRQNDVHSEEWNQMNGAYDQAAMLLAKDVVENEKK